MKRWIPIALAVWLAMILVILVCGFSRGGFDSPANPPASMAAQSEATAGREEDTAPAEPERVIGPDAPLLPTEKAPAPEETTAPAEPKQETERKAVPSSFTAREIAADKRTTLRYWLYTPADPGEDMPLIVYLHGGSGKGSDLNRITDTDGFPQYLQSGALGDVRAYVLIPQLPSDQKGWAGIHDSLYRLIQHTVSECNIDPTNISLTGHSMGGTGTWSLAAAYPTLFARIAPLSGSVRNAADTAGALLDIPVWAFVGSADTIVPPESSEEVVSLLREADADAAITVFDGADHFMVPSLAYLDEDRSLINWLIGQPN